MTVSHYWELHCESHRVKEIKRTCIFYLNLFLIVIFIAKHYSNGQFSTQTHH